MGGGGSSDNSVQQMQANAQAEQASRNAAIQRLNQVFASAEAPQYYQPDGSVWTPPNAAADPGVANSGYQAWVAAGYPGGMLGLASYLKSPAATAGNPAYTPPANATPMTVYDRIAQNTTDFLKNDLANQTLQQGRLLKFQLSRTGQLGSSQEVDATGDFTRLNNTALAKATSMGMTAALDAKNQAQAAKVNAARDINAGVDAGTATQNALESQKIAADQATAAATGSGIGDAFSNLGYLYGAYKKGQTQNQLMGYYNQGRGQVSPGTVGTAAPNYGTGSNGS